MPVFHSSVCLSCNKPSDTVLCRDCREVADWLREVKSCFKIEANGMMIIKLHKLLNVIKQIRYQARWEGRNGKSFVQKEKKK